MSCHRIGNAIVCTGNIIEIEDKGRKWRFEDWGGGVDPVNKDGEIYDWLNVPKAVYKKFVEYQEQS